MPYPWLTDTALGRWFNRKSDALSIDGEPRARLVDIVSKNGCMLLDVGPTADGTIPAEAQQKLLDMGDWLKVNGEAIYATRPWLFMAKGRPARRAAVSAKSADPPFTAQDIRFTTKGDALYAIALGWPAGGKLVVKASPRRQAR